MPHAALEIRLRGPSGEPVSFERTVRSHGLASLPPFFLSNPPTVLRTTVRLGRGRPRTLTISAATRGRARIVVVGASPAPRVRDAAVAAARHMLQLDEDLSEFYALAAADPDLVWVTGGAGRMLRAQTVFEEVVKTICTSNCAWSATIRMIDALVSSLGERAPGAPPSGAAGRAFPSPEAMAEVDADFYRSEMRAGYRGPWLQTIARSVAGGELDLEALRPDAGLSDAAAEVALRALPGIGPYGAAHTMLLIGRYSTFVLDSWTRPKYAELTGRRASDAAIARRFRRYGRFAGLAFWCFLTKGWVED